ncbi:arsenate reductase (glutaredoxin) [Sphingomonas rhizophila]|uniref:Arsenate reductase n=1 Tax=Sphingomonas rhizophila TaxID=2071607 RepID=A0A7G9S8V8_9SPHN|nr:arsenate reductase (glutaredoxin) [Sphingomonas rhizophila]QNN64283.1 arsenate reductase (glutaredoxin) [Sphingomonas rhizophila]
MKATIFHNPACGTSRKTLALLEDAGADITVIRYLETPPSRDELKRLYQRAGMSARDGLRAKEPLASELGLNDPGASEDQILDAMMAHPILINRPLVETEKGVALCRPQEEVAKLL